MIDQTGNRKNVCVPWKLSKMTERYLIFINTCSYKFLILALDSHLFLIKTYSWITSIERRSLVLMEIQFLQNVSDPGNQKWSTKSSTKSPHHHSTKTKKKTLNKSRMTMRTRQINGQSEIKSESARFEETSVPFLYNHIIKNYFGWYIILLCTHRRWVIGLSEPVRD